MDSSLHLSEAVLFEEPLKNSLETKAHNFKALNAAIKGDWLVRENAHCWLVNDLDEEIVLQIKKVFHNLRNLLLESRPICNIVSVQGQRSV